MSVIVTFAPAVVTLIMAYVPFIPAAAKESI
jgi:hypothetical protein